MESVRKIKQLKSQINSITADCELIKIDISTKQRDLSHKLNTIERLKAECAKIVAEETLMISEHAIVRYFERVKGFDLELVKNEILTDEVMSLIKKLGGNGTYPNGSFSIVVKNNTVTTII